MAMAAINEESSPPEMIIPKGTSPYKCDLTALVNYSLISKKVAYLVGIYSRLCHNGEYHLV